jgi:hypothetical protein
MIRSTTRPCAHALTSIALLLSLAVPAQAATWADVMIAYQNAVRAIAEMPTCVIWLKRDASQLATQYSIVQRCGTGGFDSAFSTQETDHFITSGPAGWCQTTFENCSDPSIILHVNTGSWIYGGIMGDWQCVIGVGGWTPIDREITTIDCLGHTSTRTVHDFGQAWYPEPTCTHAAVINPTACYNYDAVLETLTMDPPTCRIPPPPTDGSDWLAPCECVPWGYQAIATGDPAVCRFVPLPPDPDTPTPPDPPRDPLGHVKAHFQDDATFRYVPDLTTIAPAAVVRGTYDTQVTLTGQHFYADSVAQMDGAPLATTYVSDKILTATIPTAQMVHSGTAALLVATPASAAMMSSTPTLTSQAKPFTVLDPFLIDPLLQNGSEVIQPIRWSLPVSGAAIDCGTTPPQQRAGSPARCAYSAAGTYTLTGTHDHGAPNTATVTIPARPLVINQITTSIHGQNAQGITTAVDTPQPVQIQLHLTDDSGSQSTITTTVDPSTFPER